MRRLSFCREIKWECVNHSHRPCNAWAIPKWEGVKAVGRGGEGVIRTAHNVNIGQNRGQFVSYLSYVGSHDLYILLSGSSPESTISEQRGLLYRDLRVLFRGVLPSRYPGYEDVYQIVGFYISLVSSSTGNLDLLAFSFKYQQYLTLNNVTR